jgi:hypothetical protein
MTPGQMENRTCRKNKNTPQTLQKVYIPRWWSSKQRNAEKTGFKSTKIRDLWGLTDNAHKGVELSVSFCAPTYAFMQHITTSSIKHATTVPLPAYTEGEEDDGVAKTAGRRILPAAYYFQEKICAMESVGDGHHFPSATGSTRWQTVMADDVEEEEEESERRSGRSVGSNGEREERTKESLGKGGRVVSK